MKIPEGLEDVWPCLELVADRRATWTEVTEKMSVEDVLSLRRACEAIADAENGKYRELQQQAEAAREGVGRGRGRAASQTPTGPREVVMVE